MSFIVAVANQKGGVGKTTTAVNLAASLHHRSQKVLLIDLDPQGNATSASGVESIVFSTADALLRTHLLSDVILNNTPAGYDLAPAHESLTQAEVRLLAQPGREQVLSRLLTGLPTHYDWILIDCPPTLSLLTLNALTACDGVLVPVQCEYYALEGLTALMQTTAALTEWVKPDLRILGLLRTFFDPRQRLAQSVSEELLSVFPQHVLQTIIPRNIRLAEAPSQRMTGLQYDPSAKGVLAYLELADELLTRVQEITK